MSKIDFEQYCELKMKYQFAKPLNDLENDILEYLKKTRLDLKGFNVEKFLFKIYENYRECCPMEVGAKCLDFKMDEIKTIVSTRCFACIFLITGKCTMEHKFDIYFEEREKWMNRITSLVKLSQNRD